MVVWIGVVATMMMVVSPALLIWGFNQNFTEPKRGTWWWMGFIMLWVITAVVLFWLAAYV